MPGGYVALWYFDTYLCIVGKICLVSKVIAYFRVRGNCHVALRVSAVTRRSHPLERAECDIICCGLHIPVREITRGCDTFGSAVNGWLAVVVSERVWSWRCPTHSTPALSSRLSALSSRLILIRQWGAAGRLQGEFDVIFNGKLSF